MKIRVRVKAGSKEESIKKLVDGRLAVTVGEKAEAGRANARAIELLARHFAVSADKIKLISGHTSPTKVFYIPD